MQIAQIKNAVATEQQAALRVKQSLTGRRWDFHPFDQRLAEGIAQAHDLPFALARILSARGVGFDAVADFLDPTLKSSLPEPNILQGMQKAAEMIAEAIIKGRKIAVFGDYDVDGATSSALTQRFLRAVGHDCRVYIPDRIAEGYGPNIPAIEKLRAEAADLLITLDCGVTAFDQMAAAKKTGFDVVILDHHRVESQLPDVDAIVNPNRLDDTSGLGYMAAVGVTFLTLVAVNRILRQRAHYTDQRPEPRLMQWLDLVALGTVCDVVPLVGLNRAFVAQGLRVMAMRGNPGLAALCDVAGVAEAPTAFHLGFMLGPRVNAGGRVADAAMGAQLLATNDPIIARQLAQRLHDVNAERREVEKGVLDHAMRIAEEQMAAGHAAILVSGEGWHPGVIGIVAARIKEKFRRPACVVAFDEKGVGKASGRSAGAIDLGAAVAAARENGLLIAGGGHKMAAGFTVAADRLEDLHTFLSSHIAEQAKGLPVDEALLLDGVLSGAGLTLALAEQLTRLAPFGAGHAEPRFAVNGVKIIKATVVGENHVSCFIQDTAGGASVKAIAFRALDTELGEALLKSQGKVFHLAGHLTVNTWQGRTSANFQIVDAAYAE